MDNRERAMLHALALEWRIARSNLPRAIQRVMTMPGLELHDTAGRWGLWHSGRNTISLSRQLLENYSWPSVVEVLRHEMAHQLVDQLYGDTVQPHGPAFQEACILLGADSRASSALPSVYQRLDQVQDAEGGKREVIHKLLALATSPHPAEAEAAMLKAHALMVKHNITPDAEDAAAYVSICLGKPGKRHFAADYELAAILRQFFFVETIFVHMAMPESGVIGRILEITGTPENVKMAVYVWEFLKRAAVETGRSHSRKLDYALGFFRGVREKLARQRKDILPRRAPEHALIHDAHFRLQQAFRKRHPRLRTAHATGGSFTDAYNAGMTSGRKLVIHRPIENKGANNGNLLPE